MTTLPYVSLSNMYHAIWISSTKYRCCQVKPSIKKKSNSLARSCLQVRNDRWLITPNYSFIQHSDLLLSLNESNQIKMSASFTCHSKTTIMWLFNKLLANSTKHDRRWVVIWRGVSKASAALTLPLGLGLLAAVHFNVPLDYSGGINQTLSRRDNW